MDITEWLDTLTDGSTSKDIARKSGISERTLQHQTRSGKLSVENAVKISAAYSRHPLRTLIDFGVIDQAWEQVPDVEAALRIAQDAQLTDEILRRLDLADYDPIYDEPVDQLADRRRKKSLPPENNADADDKKSDPNEPTPAVSDGEYPDLLLASHHTYNPDTGEYEETMPEDAVADDSPEEGGTPEDFES